MSHPDRNMLSSFCIDWVSLVFFGLVSALSTAKSCAPSGLAISQRSAGNHVSVPISVPRAGPPILSRLGHFFVPLAALISLLGSLYKLFTSLGHPRVNFWFSLLLHKHFGCSYARISLKFISILQHASQLIIAELKRVFLQEDTMSQPAKSLSLREEAAATLCPGLQFLLAVPLWLVVMTLATRIPSFVQVGTRSFVSIGGVLNLGLAPSGTSPILDRLRLSLDFSGLDKLPFLRISLASVFPLNFYTGSTTPEPSSIPPSASIVSGKVTYEGTPPKYRPLDMTNEPTCAKTYATPPMPEAVVTGVNNSLQNVVIYVSAGLPDEAAPTQVIAVKQHGCRYIPHVLAMQTNQEMLIVNEDSVTHTIHPMAKANKEWNRSQPPGTPPFAIKYDKPEFIRVKCELHPWMRGIFAVLENSHYAITDDKGSFTFPGLPPGKYTISAWHESFGEQSQEIVVGGGETKSINFVFKAKPY